MPDTSSMDDLLGLQQAFEERLHETLAEGRRGEPDPESALAARASRLERLRARLDEMTADREAAMRRWNDDIARLTEEIDSVDRQLTEDRAALGETGEGDMQVEEVGGAETEGKSRPQPARERPSTEVPREPRPRVKKRRSKS